MKRILPIPIIYGIILLISYILVIILYNNKSGNSLLIGYLISCVDLLLLARFMFAIKKKASSIRAVIMSTGRWGFVGICVYLSLVYINVIIPFFVLGIILPFAGVFLIVIYFNFRRKGNG